MSAQLGADATASPRPVDVALWFAMRDWPVAPLAPMSKRPAANCARCAPSSDGSIAHAPESCACIRSGRWCHAFHAATTDLDRIRTWWTENPDFGVSISTGPARLLVLDVDRHQVRVPTRDRLLPGIHIPAQVDLTGLSNGFDTLALLAALRGQKSPADDNETLRTRTPMDGVHVYYRLLPHHPEFRTSTGSSTTAALAWQVDVKASRGSVIAPGTVTRNGTYRRLGDERMPAPAPEWLIEELERTGHRIDRTGGLDASSAGHIIAPIPAPADRRPQRVPQRGRAPAHARLTPLLAAVENCAAAPSGQAFTEHLNRAAFTAGGLVAAGRIDREEAVSLLTNAARFARPQYPKSIAIINSGLQAGAHRPFQD